MAGRGRSAQSANLTCMRIASTSSCAVTLPKMASFSPTFFFTTNLPMVASAVACGCARGGGQVQEAYGVGTLGASARWLRSARSTIPSPAVFEGLKRPAWCR